MAPATMAVMIVVWMAFRAMSTGDLFGYEMIRMPDDVIPGTNNLQMSRIYTMLYTADMVDMQPFFD